MPVPGTSMRTNVPGEVFGGPLFTWGDSSNGKLGDGQTVTDFSSPIAIGSQNWKKINSGGSGLGGAQDGHTLAIRDDGTLWAWGGNGSGQLGDSTNTNRSSPVQIGASRWIDAKAGGGHSVAIREDGLLFTWGQGNVGQLGNGGTGNTNSPIQIGSNSWQQVGAGADISYGLRSDGLLFAWGLNNNGQVGDGSTSTRLSPVQVGASSWTKIGVTCANASHMLATRVDGLLFGWGLNTTGQIGDGTAVNKSSPVQIGALSWVNASMGNGGSVMIRSDGLMFTTGLGTAGELGDSTLVTKSSPVQVGSSSWFLVRAGASRAAIDITGRLFTWGGNISGQLGLGDTATRSSPVQVGAALWADVGLGCNAAFTSFFTAGLRRVT